MRAGVGNRVVGWWRCDRWEELANDSEEEKVWAAGLMIHEEENEILEKILFL